MKTSNAARILALVVAGLMVQAAGADSYSIDSDSYGAIAYSTATGRYGYTYNYRSRSSAERGALAHCGRSDAEVVAWVNFGWAVLVIAEDNAYGTGVTYGEGSTSRDALARAVRNLRKHSSSRIKTVVVICSGDVRPRVYHP